MSRTPVVPDINADIDGIERRVELLERRNSTVSAGGNGAPSGSAGGDLGGSYPNPNVLFVGGKAAASITAKFAATIGNGSATEFVITHNLGTVDVVVGIRDTGTLKEVIAEVEHTSLTTITVRFTSPPATASRRVVVIG